MSTDKYLVSVITPTYNSERTIRCTIDSVLSQSYNNIEMIIVDDCSLDNTVSICREYQKKIQELFSFQMRRIMGLVCQEI